MEKQPADVLRTIGIVAHVDAGKTTLTERILFETGARVAQGSVEDGTAATDWMRQEQERGISIQSAAVRVAWERWILQILDTPGHVDFSAEVVRCLRVLDGVIVVLDGVRGVESQTRTVWQKADRWRCARIVFVNKMDRPSADFAQCMRSVVDVLGGNPVAIAIPLFDNDRRLLGVGDVLRGGLSSLVDSVSDRDADRFRQELLMARELAVEACADKDDELLALVLSGAPVTDEELVAALRRQTIAGSIVPVVAGSALVGVGVDILLDAVGELMPSLGDRDRRGVEGWFPPPVEDAPLQALVFKVEHRDSETVAYARVFDGRISRGEWLWRNGEAEPFPALDLWTPQASARQPSLVAKPGEIVGLAVPASTRTGDTLVGCAGGQVLLGCDFPAPVISILLEPSDPRAIESLRRALDAILADDPTLQVATDLETGLPIVAGLGELHLEIVAERVEELAKCDIRRSRPRVAVRWRLAGEGRAHAVAGNSGQPSAASADVFLRPRPEGSGCSVEIGDAVPTHLAERAEEIARAWLRHPGRIGGEVVDAEVRVDRIMLESGDEPGVAFAAAVEDALGLAVARAGCHRLEPLVNFRVQAPEEAGSVVLADLHLRKAEIREVRNGRLGAVVEGSGTLRAFLGYATRLRSLTKGLGEADLQIAGFGVVSAAEGPLPAQN